MQCKSKWTSGQPAKHSPLRTPHRQVVCCVCTAKNRGALLGPSPFFHCCFPQRGRTFGRSRPWHTRLLVACGNYTTAGPGSLNARSTEASHNSNSRRMPKTARVCGVHINTYDMTAVKCQMGKLQSAPDERRKNKTAKWPRWTFRCFTLRRG